MLQLVRAAGIPIPEGMVGAERALEAFAVMLIERCAAIVDCMRLCDETDVVSEAYNVGITDGTEALRMAAAMLRALQI